MRIYIIDGCNLAHRLPVKKKEKTFYLEVIRYIKKERLTGSKKNQAVVVFDGFAPLEITHEENFRIIFSQRKKADTVIGEILQRMGNKSIVYVVSDDREIQDYVRRQQANVLSLKEFLKIKEREEGVLEEKRIDYCLEKEITEELRKVWLGE